MSKTPKGDDDQRWFQAIQALRLIADDLPNAQDYPISNLLTIIDNIAYDSLPSGMLAEVKAISDEWVKKL